MRTLLLAMASTAALAAVVPASAELYRWVDPQSGSVKFSSVPPPWYGDASREATSPKVEVINLAPKPAAPGAAEKAAAQAAAIQGERRREEALRLKAKPEAAGQ